MYTQRDLDVYIKRPSAEDERAAGSRVSEPDARTPGLVHALLPHHLRAMYVCGHIYSDVLGDI